VQKIFEQVSHPQFTGTIIWEPMMADDDFEAAITQQDLFQDNRVQHYWDADKVLGKIIADSMLENTPSAWDIYLLYQPGAIWDNGDFPNPDIWMHQLPEDERLRLNPEKLLQEVIETINRLSDEKVIGEN
jgi:hypothetical protein